MGLLATGFRNIHSVIHHQIENFAQGMPTDLTLRLAACGPGCPGNGEMADYDAAYAAGEDPFNWIRIHPLFPECADFPFDHAGVGETALMLDPAPDRVDVTRARQGEHGYTETAPQATAELGERGGALALTQLRSVLGLSA